MPRVAAPDKLPATTVFKASRRRIVPANDLKDSARSPKVFTAATQVFKASKRRIVPANALKDSPRIEPPSLHCSNKGVQSKARRIAKFQQTP